MASAFYDSSSFLSVFTVILMGSQLVQASTTNAVSPFLCVRSNTLGSTSSFLTSIKLFLLCLERKSQSQHSWLFILLGWMTLTFSTKRSPGLKYFAVSVNCRTYGIDVN